MNPFIMYRKGSGMIPSALIFTILFCYRSYFYVTYLKFLCCILYVQMFQQYIMNPCVFDCVLPTLESGHEFIMA